MLDLTSSLYLGMRHASASLQPWQALTLGRPSALREPPCASKVAAELAELQGCEAATVLPSTLHLFWDLFRVLCRAPAAILCDAGTYPIAKWGTERAAAHGVQVRTFAHHDPRHLAALADDVARRARRPIVVADGYCARCNHAAPVNAYAAIAERHGGYLVLDDTQAMGLLGAAPSAGNPFGSGGGGSLRWHGAHGPHIVVGSSLAKAFGAPLAVLAGSHEIVERFERESDTRLHCSPPSIAAIHATSAALDGNRRRGDRVRARLVKLVSRFRELLIGGGWSAAGLLPFPVQTFAPPACGSVASLHARLLRAGIAGLATTVCGAGAAALTFIVNICQRLDDLERAASSIVLAGNPVARAS